MIYASYEIVTSIAKALEPFGLPVYVDEVKSNIVKPCFIVLEVNSSHHILPHKMYKDNVSIQVVYIPKNDNNGVNFELMKVASELNAILRVLKLEDDFYIRGHNLRSYSLQSTLFYDVDYRILSREVNDTPVMTELQIERGDIDD